LVQLRVSRGCNPWGPPLEGRVWEGSKAFEGLVEAFEGLVEAFEGLVEAFEGLVEAFEGLDRSL
ncbi:hypothetical protein L1N85_02545, partial [Paenibacillus alkaliterrae]|uniref:hypothetical protein n=1 Tax=Paenibacillus alkaliterrae TaxID=320909 RepID=UPI001F40F4F2